MIAVLADTHTQRGERRLPERCVELVAEAEATIHAGDLFAASVLEHLRVLCQIFNPGSPTERRRAPRPSMGLLSCANGRLAFEHVWL
ncbi:MAG TPA: hypothetical protein VFI09_05830 [Solirubrobacterales bacterium]|nr:hypothetical protein [Solirubrobacterales bacterium]